LGTGWVFRLHLRSDAMQAHRTKGVFEDHRQSFADVALALVFGHQPEADLTPTVWLHNVVQPYGAKEGAVLFRADGTPYSGAIPLDAGVPVHLLLRGFQGGEAHTVMVDNLGVG